MATGVLKKKTQKNMGISNLDSLLSEIFEEPAEKEYQPIKLNNVIAIMTITDTIFVTYFRKIFSNMKIQEYFNLFEKSLVYNSESQVIINGKQVKIPRKQIAYGEPGISYHFSGTEVKTNDWNKDDEICKTICRIKERAELLSNTKFNFVLINRYNDGDDYIGFHSDDEKDLVKNSPIVGVTIGAERDFILKSNSTNKKHTLRLHSGSMIIMHSPTNKYWKHSVPKRASVKAPRISLTFRKMI